MVLEEKFSDAWIPTILKSRKIYILLLPTKTTTTTAKCLYGENDGGS